MRTPYDILGVDRDADQAAIKAAYKSRSKATHPDKDGGNEDEFKAVAAAWECLGDPDKRARYDETGEMPSMDRETDLGEAAFLQMLNKHLRPGKITSTKSLLKAVREDLERAREQAKDQILEIKAQIGTYEKHLGRYKSAHDPATLEPYGENLIESSLAAAIASCNGAIAVGEAELKSIEGALMHCLRYVDPREGESDELSRHVAFVNSRNFGRHAAMMEDLLRSAGI